jgi:hypothetical protein
MRTISAVFATLLLTALPAIAESQWLESGRLDPSQISAICKRTSDVRTLARMQMMSTGDAHWLRLTRQELVVEGFVMGEPPLNPGRCYVVARAGHAGETVRRFFEVRDFAVSPESATVFVLGRDYDPPSKSAPTNR